MKQTLTFNLSTIASTESKIKVDYFDTSVEAFDNGEYLQSFYALLDYVNDEFREKYGNAKGTEFNIPHGSIVVNIKIENDWLLIHAPFLSLPEKNRIPLLRQVAGLNFNAMDLAQVELKKDRLAFEHWQILTRFIIFFRRFVTRETSMMTSSRPSSGLNGYMNRK